jgi:uncharacterized membrane protein YdcZ (DUF606 family)
MKRFSHWMATAPIIQFYSFLLGTCSLVVLAALLFNAS